MTDDLVIARRRHVTFTRTSWVRMIALVAVLVTMVAIGSSSAAESPSPPVRPAWTTSRVVGSPEPPLPFRVERVLPEVRFDLPTLVAFLPGTDRIVVGEQAGKIWTCSLGSAGSDQPVQKDLLIDLAAAIPRPDGVDFDACYGLAFDPQFLSNRLVYVCYVWKTRDGSVLADGSRVVRFRLPDGPSPVLDASAEELLYTYRAGGHNGGCLEFGPDGYLYISTGDGAGPNPPDLLNTGQDCTDDLSSILRIDVHPVDKSQRYAVPSDNPFVGRPTIRPEIWSYGFRNPWKMTFDRATGELWVGDVGWDQWELVHRVGKGGNYGWSAFEGPQPIRTDLPLGPSPVLPPFLSLPHAIAASITGGYVYRGQRFPELVGHYVFGDWETKRIWGVDVQSNAEPVLKDLAETPLQIVAFGEDLAGELWIADYAQGGLFQLVRHVAPSSPDRFPKRLSETGLFDPKDLQRQQPQVGVWTFDINQPQWSDYATADRWIAMPGHDPILWHPADRPIPGSMFARQHDYPVGTVLAKTLSHEMVHGDPASSKKLETQLLHFDGVTWRGYTYAWNEEQTDADLVPAQGAEQTLQVRDSRWPGGVRTQRWQFHSRLQCASCHTPWAQYALAFHPLQLNRTVQRDGGDVNQLEWLRQQGLLCRVDDQQQRLLPEKATPFEQLPRLAAVDDLTASAAELSRGYLHANCSHCHRFNGGGAGSFELLHSVAEDKLKLVGEFPRQGLLGVVDARLLTAQRPDLSVLYLRMAKFGRGRMPHLGSELVDEQALRWLRDWINGLPVTPASSQSTADALQSHSSTPSVVGLPTTLREAELLARQLGRGELSPDTVEPILIAAAEHPDLLVQDLFAGYQPEARRRKTLGSQMVPEHILPLTGSAERGERLFWHTPAVTCQACHNFRQPEKQIGPNLTQIMPVRQRHELLQSLWKPSEQIEPRYRTMVVETTAGAIISGLLISENEDSVTLRDARGEDRTILVADIESRETSALSLMPEGLLKDLTAQEVADLLSYLESIATSAATPRAP
jgi:putative heme-binding domain-containing protein